MILQAMLAIALASAPVRVAVIGDRTGGSDEPEFEASLEAAMLLRPDVIVNVGDLIEGYTEDTDELSAEWDYVLGVLGRFAGDIPVVLVPGNHDITYDSAEAVWREKISAEPSRVLRVAGVEFVIWDTSRMAWPDSAGISGLENLLRGVRRSDTAVLLTHQPFWMMEGDTATSTRIRELAERYDLEAVIGGHIHTYSGETVGGVLYASMCTSGGDFGTRDPESGRLTQIAWLTLDGDSASLAVVDPHGIYPVDLNTTAEEQLQYSIESRMLEPRPLEQALESAALTIHSMEDVDRTVSLVVRPGNWGLSPESLVVELPAGESRTVYFSQNPSGSPFPSPVLEASIQYGSRGKTAEFSSAWQAMRTAVAPPSTVTVDGTRAEGEYPEAAETAFALSDGSASPPGETTVWLATDGSRLCFYARMVMTPADDLSSEAFGVVVEGDDGGFIRVKVFPDGGASAIAIGGSGISDLEGGWEAASFSTDGSWLAEISLDLDALGIAGSEARGNFYRLGADDEVMWSWPLEFEDGYMGTIVTGR